MPDTLIAGAYLCYYERRRGKMLGTEYCGQSNAVFFQDVLISVFIKLPCVSAQLGDGSSGNLRATPHDVVGLSSGVVSLALSYVQSLLSHFLFDSRVMEKQQRKFFYFCFSFFFCDAVMCDGVVV
jgi:hypothetical protein